MSISNRYFLVISLILAVTLRLAAAYHVGFNTLSFGDAADYIAAAQTLCDTGDYPLRSSLPFFRAPGLPFFIAVTSGCNVNPVTAKLVLILVDSLSVLVIYRLAQVMTENYRTSWIAAISYAISPFFIWQSTDVASEPLFSFLLMSSLLLLLYSRARSRFTMTSMLFLALATLTRPAALSLAPLWISYCIFISWQEEQPKKRISHFLLVLIPTVAFTLTLTPWVTYNYIRYGELILINDAGMYNLWRANSPAMIEVDKAQNSKSFIERSYALEVISNEYSAQIYAENPDANFSGRSQAWWKLFITDIRQSPNRFISYLGDKTMRFWRPWLNSTTHDTYITIVSAVYFSVLYLGALFGLIQLLQLNRAIAVFLLCYVAIAWASHIPFQVVTRFRTSFIDPPAFILCAHLLSNLLTVRKNKLSTKDDARLLPAAK